MLWAAALAACAPAVPAAPDAALPADAAADDLGSAGCPQVQPPQSTGCAAWSAQPAAGKLPASALDEVSGLVVSRKNSTATTSVLWLHNDSGDTARVFAVAVGAGPPRLLATYSLAGVTAIDWEDLALGPAPGRSGDFLYLGDIGNNFNRVPRRSSIQIYRIPEPTVDLAKTDQRLTVNDAERIDLVYEGGQVYDCESLLIDPQSAELVLLTKDIFAGPSFAFRAPPVVAAMGTITLTPIVDCQNMPRPLRFPDGERPAVTGADIAAVGDTILVRAYSGIFLWNRLPGESIGAALGREPCALPSANERQGESIGFSPDAATYYTTSEGAGAEISVFHRN